jgi:hypothetical protein
MVGSGNGHREHPKSPELTGTHSNLQEVGRSQRHDARPYPPFEPKRAPECHLLTLALA